MFWGSLKVLNFQNPKTAFEGWRPRMIMIPNKIDPASRLLRVATTQNDKSFHMQKQQNEILSLAYRDIASQYRVKYLDGYNYDDDPFLYLARETHLELDKTLLRWESYRRRTKNCLTWLEFLRCVFDPTHPQKLSLANFCKVRLCPCCQKRRSFKQAETMLKVAEETLRRYPSMKFLFLTLTVPNVTLAELEPTLKHITQSWNRLMNRKVVKRIIKGYHRAIEITYNGERNDYHPHLHIILAVNSRYFAEDYISHEKWLEMWQQSTKQPEITQVDIRAIKSGGKANQRLVNAVSEACKYSLKTFNFKCERTGTYKGRISNPEHRKLYKKLLKNEVQIIYGIPNHIFIRDTPEETAFVVDGLTDALHRKKFTHFGGIFKDIKKDLELEDGEEIDDLIHLTDKSSDCFCPICNAERRKILYNYCSGMMGMPVREYLLSADYSD